MSVLSFEKTIIKDKKEALLECGCVLEDDGWYVTAVLVFNDGGNDERRVQLDLLGLALVVTGERTLACLAFDVLIFTAVTFLFFFGGFDGDAIVSLLCG